MLFFEWVFPLISEETNGYLQQNLAAWDRLSTSATWDVKMEELYCFLALAVWKGHDQKDSIKD
jgi:hypothetical protein